METAVKADITAGVSKSQLRREVLKQRNELDNSERNRASCVLSERIIGHQWYYLSDSLLGFVPYGSEIDVTDILKDALRKGKKLYLPKVLGEEMQFFRVSSLEELESGYKGIWEPRGEGEAFAYEEETVQRTLLLMPGVAFDGSRNRIGYGKGFYDKYLQDKELLQLRSIAVGFKCQMLKEIPSQELDIKPYQVICV